jgi:hypothetical protein
MLLWPDKSKNRTVAVTEDNAVAKSKVVCCMSYMASQLPCPRYRAIICMSVGVV